MKDPKDYVITGWIWMFSARGSVYTGGDYDHDVFHMPADATGDDPGPAPEAAVSVVALLHTLGIEVTARAVPLWDGEEPDEPTWDAWSTSSTSEFRRLAAIGALERIEAMVIKRLPEPRLCDEYGCHQHLLYAFEHTGKTVRDIRNHPHGFEPETAS